MEANTFDQIVGGLARHASRRRMVGGVIGAATAALTGGVGLGAKTKPSTGRRRRRPSPGGATDLVTICHVTTGSGDATRLRVGGRALRKHLAHGDVRYQDCCVNGDCKVGACYSAKCIHGACVKTQLPQGTPCQLDWPLGGLGGCTQGGHCVPTVTSGG
jgi:hypothetical protein